MRLPALRLLPRPRALVPALQVGPHWRRRLTALALVVAMVGAAYLLWLRDSSLVRVERVAVVGLAAAPDAPRLRSELTAAAKEMTTLHLDADRLRRIAAGDPVVRGIVLRTDFPHGLEIQVIENRPVALVSNGDRGVPVAADGTLLAGVDTDGLPTVKTVSMPDGRRLGGGATLDRVAVAGAAPEPLRRRVEAITIQPEKGFVAQLRDGPAIWLGSGPQLELKWRAAAAVLADKSSRGAAYLDVRMPERAVAGGLAVTHEPQPGASDAAPAAGDAVAPAAPTGPVAPAPAAPAPNTQP